MRILPGHELIKRRRLPAAPGHQHLSRVGTWVGNEGGSRAIFDGVPVQRGEGRGFASRPGPRRQQTKPICFVAHVEA